MRISDWSSVCSSDLALIATDPHDPYFLELKGQILLESGKPRQALPPLREAVQRSGNKPMITAMLGHALIATEDPANFEEARRILKLSVARDNENQIGRATV